MYAPFLYFRVTMFEGGTPRQAVYGSADSSQRQADSATTTVTARRTDVDRALYEYVGARFRSLVHTPSVHGREGENTWRRARGVDDNRARIAALRHTRNLRY